MARLVRSGAVKGPGDLPPSKAHDYEVVWCKDNPPARPWQIRPKSTRAWRELPGDLDVSPARARAFVALKRWQGSWKVKIVY